MLREQSLAAVSSGMGEKKDASYVAVFLCQEHQLRGICLSSLVIVESMLVAIVL